MASGIFSVEDADPRDQSQLESLPCLSSLNFFDAIPPERMGLNGEYDYHGLTKRVYHAFYEHMTAEELRSIKVKQRGAVIILSGRVSTCAQLVRLIHIALSVSGTVEVEADGVVVQDGRGQNRPHSKFFGSRARTRG